METVTKHRLKRQLHREERHKQWLKDNLPGSPQQRQNQYRILLARTRMIEVEEKG